jgi:hypothetical protein
MRAIDHHAYVRRSRIARDRWAAGGRTVVSYSIDQLPADATGLKLHRIDARDNLISCEPVYFVRGRAAVDTTLRRAAISGRVEIDGDIENHFADIINADGSWEHTVSLDGRSYRALKNRWMRCKIARAPSSARGADEGGR